jgi:hypothetical protein
MAPPLPLSAVLVLFTFTADSILHGLFGPALRAGSQRSALGPAATWPGSRWSRLRPPPPPTSARSLPRHNAHGTVPRSRSPRTFPTGSCPSLIPGLGHGPLVTAPCSRKAVTSPDGPPPQSRLRGPVPLLLTQVTPGSHLAPLEAQSWSCVARWHAAALYSKLRAGPSFRAACFITC